MSSTAELPFRRAGVAVPPLPSPWSTRWYGRLLLLLIGAGLLTAALAPANQFYLAWVGLVPWLIVMGGVRSFKAAFLWGWIGGTLFFVANMWWMAAITLAGMFGLMALLGLYWGYAGMIIHGARLLAATEVEPVLPRVWDRLRSSPGVRLLLLACTWVTAAEWFRGTWPWHGLPWLYLGHSQSPLLPICQIVDLTGVAGLSFLIVLVNGWIALWINQRLDARGLRSSGVIIAACVVASVGYGLVRMRTLPLVDGPRVVVVQPNYPQDPTGQKGASPEEMTQFHLDATATALRTAPGADLAVWSETMLPPINPQARAELAGYKLHQVIEDAIDSTGAVARRFHTAVLSGGEFWADLKPVGNILLAADRRNAAYFFDRTGQLTDLRYDKIHLVPFGEFTPFKQGFPWLYRLIVHFGPPDMDYYNLQTGDENALTVFPLPKSDGTPGWNLVTPICFEDIDGNLCARMVRPDPATPNTKRADVLINLTNDGWFKANENAEHFQAAIFRSIEDRVPMARAVNTGISGFIDPLGRTSHLLSPRTAGTSMATLPVCATVTFFTRHGPVFADSCVAVTIGVVLVWLVHAIVQRRLRHRPTDFSGEIL